MSLWEAALLGLVQGLTEFLPISSTAHLLFVRSLLGHERPEDAFTVVIQMGTLFAVIAYFWGEVRRLARGLWTDVISLRVGATPEGVIAWMVILGTVPVVLAGVTLKSWLKATFFNLPSVAIVATVFALLLALAEGWTRYRASQGSSGRSEGDLRWWDALWIGCWQALALMPGASRSGTTLTGGLFAGLTRPVAARFSFVLSLPAITAASIKEVYDEGPALFASWNDLAALLTALLVSAVVGYLSIAWLLHYLKRYTTAVFIIYRLFLGITLAILISLGVVN